MKKVKRFFILMLILLIGFGTVSSKEIDLSGFFEKIVAKIDKAFESNDDTGKASFYADKYNGRPTSSGEIFSQQKLTAAHRTLPFGTNVLVTNKKNGKSVVVKINDRGPFVYDRMIDLSKAAAVKLDMISDGVAEVEMKIVN